MNRLTSRRCLTLALLIFSLQQLCRADSAEFHKTLPVSNADPVKLAIDIAMADIEVAYSRDGEVVVTAIARTSGLNKIDENYFRVAFNLEQAGNEITIHQMPIVAGPSDDLKLQIRIDVPYRTEITSSVGKGSQSVRGVTGPVELRGKGNVSVAYVSKTATVDVERGNLSFQMVADHVFARTGSGNISAERLPKGIRAETGDGDIKLMVIGAAEAIVRAGSGRIEVGGARDTLMADTKGGDLLVEAVPHGDWDLCSNSGAIRLELPPQVSAKLEVSSESGRLQFEREDLPNVAPDARQFSQPANSGDRKIRAHTKTGDIWIR